MDSGGGRKTRRGRQRNNDDAVMEKDAIVVDKDVIVDKAVIVEQNEQKSEDLVDKGKIEHDCVCVKLKHGKENRCCVVTDVIGGGTAVAQV